MTDEERRAVASLKRLAKKWPKSLTLFSAAGSLIVIRTGTERGAGSGSGEVLSPDDVLAYIDGIPNDGGDPW